MAAVASDLELSKYLTDGQTRPFVIMATDDGRGQQHMTHHGVYCEQIPRYHLRAPAGQGEKMKRSDWLRMVLN